MAQFCFVYDLMERQLKLVVVVTCALMFIYKVAFLFAIAVQAEELIRKWAIQLASKLGLILALMQLRGFRPIRKRKSSSQKKKPI
jgi:hypothetical protein